VERKFGFPLSTDILVHSAVVKQKEYRAAKEEDRLSTLIEVVMEGIEQPKTFP